MGGLRNFALGAFACLPGLVLSGALEAAEVTFVNNSAAEELDWYMLEDDMDYYICSSSPGGGTCSSPFSPGRVNFEARNWDGIVVCDIWKSFIIKEGQGVNVLTYPDECR